MDSKLLCIIATPQQMQHDRHQGMVFPRQEYAKALTLGQLICFIQEASIRCYIWKIYTDAQIQLINFIELFNQGQRPSTSSQ